MSMSKNENVLLLQPPPHKLEDAQRQIFTLPLLNLLEESYIVFKNDIESMYVERLRKKHLYRDVNILPTFLPQPRNINWSIGRLPSRLRCRHLELGDVSPSNTAHFVDALNCDVQSVQVDFDDGHCPTWKNQIQGFFNVIQAINGKLSGAPCNISTCPVLMLRPRAWNIIEHNILVCGKEIPGPLVDFVVLMYHCGKVLSDSGNGPFFYLSKVESASEARLWNEIFVWIQNKLSIPQGTIKACVLIENILSVFESEEILFSLKDHSLGLNCGIWDYIASILVKFGNRPSFILPDRFKYVNVNATFIKSYLSHIVKVCHLHGAPATGGMIASILMPGSDGSSEECMNIISETINLKQKEILLGVDGFLVYDMRLVPPLQKLWRSQFGLRPNQINYMPETNFSESSLLEFPSGHMYFKSLQHNIAVSILFVYNWLAGIGHFFYKGKVEDSATAEISRCQVWQCIRHQIALEDTKKDTIITYTLVNDVAQEFVVYAYKHFCRSTAEKKRLKAAKFICMELFSALYPPDFITTYLNDSHKFRTIHNKELLTSIKSHL